MRVFRVFGLLVAAFGLLVTPPAIANGNNTHPAGSSKYVPTITETTLKYYLENPRYADGVRYATKDSAGNSMDSLSILQLTNQPYKYAGVYHTITNDRIVVNLAVSNDLLNWTHKGLLLDHAGMPRIGNVRGSSWIVVAHEDWTGGSNGISGEPVSAGFALFYDANDLLNRTIRSTYNMPYHGPYTHYTLAPRRINGTPSIYDMELKLYGNYFSVDGQYGFHIGQGVYNQKDVNGVTTIARMFDPTGGTASYPSTATAYNNRMTSLGAIGGIGQRDTIVTSHARYNIQEIHQGRIGTDWEDWDLILYKFDDPYNYPTGNGQATELFPQTHGGSGSFGNPSIAIVDRPDGNGHAIVVSYYLFHQAAAQGEAGALLYYFNL